MDYAKMKVLVFIFIISTAYLVLADEKLVDKSVTYKVHPDPDPEDVPENDQIAESSQSVNHGVVITQQDETPERGQNHIQLTDVRHDAQQTQQEVHIQEGVRHNSEIVHPALSQSYAQPIYVQQYPLQPIRIFGAEASPLHQTREEDNSGYTTYVEHVTPKDEEEIQSALKEGSVEDIKRLVPKSGISFKIYSSDKNANFNLKNQKTEIHSNVLHSGISGYSGLQYNTEAPVAELKIQTQQPVLQHTYLQGQQQHVLGSSQHILQDVGSTDQHNANGQTIYLTHPVVSTPKTLLEVNGKAPINYKTNLGDNNYGKATAAEYNSLSGGRDYGQDFSQSHYQKQWSLDSKAEGSSKNIKPFSTLQYEIDPVAQAEKSKGLQYTQSQPTSYAVHNNYDKHKPVGDTVKNGNYLSNSYVIKSTGNRVHDRKAVTNNRLSGTVESVKVGQNHVVGHLGGNAYGNTQHFKASQNDHYTSSYSDSETSKSGQQSYVAKNSYVEAKNGQNNFDHQKALEGSTSFDIKNAIDSTGNLIHQQTPATEIPHFEIQKQQLAYVIPKIQASTVLVDNSLHESPIISGHQVKEFGHGGISSPQLSYHAISSPEVSGKFLHQPQTVVWSSEHLKHGNANDLHQSIIKLQFPREEFYQHVKAPSVELPTSTLSQVSYSQHKPFVLHYDSPTVKYPQEIHFQTKTKPGIQSSQANHIKLAQPVSVDWSLFKSAMPNFNINSLTLKPEKIHVKETGKKIVPILVRVRKNRSNNKQEVGVVYGKVNNNRRPAKPNHRQEKNIRVNLLPEASNTVKQFEGNGERQNEFSVSASYKVDRSFLSPHSS